MAGKTTTSISEHDAEHALAYLAEMSPDLRGAAIVDSSGRALAASREPSRWSEDAAALLEVADRAGGEPVEQVHIGTEQGEVFLMRIDGVAIVAVTERFALSSVLFFDMRSILRDLSRGTGEALS